MMKDNIVKSEIQYQELPNAKPSEADILIQRVAFGGAVSGESGTERAPDAILEISEQLEYYDEDLEWSPMKYMSVCVSESVSKYREIKPSTKALLQGENQLLISLGGDHSITPQITRGLLASPSTIVFLDAHADLRESYMGDPYSHATPVHHLLCDGHRVIMIGIRSIYEEEAIRIKEDEMIEFYGDRMLRDERVKQRLFERIRSLEGDIYLSIDMDAFNPAFVPSVGTPQPGGLDYYFATDILEALFLNSDAKVLGADLVELIPEASTVSQTFTAKILQKIISYWGKSQGFEHREMCGSQMQVEYD